MYSEELEKLKSLQATERQLSADLREIKANIKLKKLALSNKIDLTNLVGKCFIFKKRGAWEIIKVTKSDGLYINIRQIIINDYIYRYTQIRQKVEQLYQYKEIPEEVFDKIESIYDEYKLATSKTYVEARAIETDNNKKATSAILDLIKEV